jgi:hypothetical protein
MADKATVAVGVGRLVPAVTHGSRWPFRALGIGFGLIAVAVLLVGAVRQRETADALRRVRVRAHNAAGWGPWSPASLWDGSGG